MQIRENGSQHQHRVDAFMTKAGQAVRMVPTIPTEQERVRMAKLILEEALETIGALGVEVSMKRLKMALEGVMLVDPLNGPIEGCLNFAIPPKAEPNLEEIVDGCCDLKVVTTCVLSGCGIADLEPQRRIDEANLRKFEPPKCPECGEKMELTHLDQQTGRVMWQCSKTPVGHPLLPREAGPYRREDGKHVKPPYWEKPKLDDLVKVE